MITEINVIVLLKYHEIHYIATPMYSSHFKSYSHAACSMLVTYTTQPTHFARHLHTGHDTKHALSAADKRSTI